MTSKLNVALICKIRGSLMWLAYLFDMVSMGVCTTRHLQTSGRRVQELNVCTVGYAIVVRIICKCSDIPFFKLTHS